MKKYSLALFVFVSIIGISSCKKINEATNIGDGLIPPVDNVNTFKVEFEVNSINKRFFDSTRVGYFDHVALGHIDDPVFGSMHANFAFNLGLSSTYGVYPFKFPKDTLVKIIDSVVLQLAYAGAYGDTLGNGMQTVSVYEMDQASGFSDTTSYMYADPNSDFNGALIGSKTYTIQHDLDSSLVVQPGDTSYVRNVLRIKLNNSLGEKLASFDTAANAPNNGFRNDSLFKSLFPGLSVKSANSGNALAYFNLSDVSNTRLTVYYRYNYDGRDTTGTVNFTHFSFGQANYVDVQAGGDWQPAIDNSNADKVFINGAPSGSYGQLLIPELDNMENKVIHRAEIVMPAVGVSTAFPPPSRLFLDRKKGGDSTWIFPNDMSVNIDGSMDLDLFGGTLKNGEYVFNITRYVQSIVTRNERNDTLRVFAPFRTTVYVPAFGFAVNIPVLRRIADGRVVLAGGNYAVPEQRMRMRIIYSNL